MTNKRQIKKALNNMIFDIVDDAYSVQLFNEAKTAESDKLIDESVEFQVTTLSKISRAKTKPEFRAIIEEIENKADDLFDKVSKL